MVDYSSALPWLLSGFIAGLLLYALIRALLGIDRKRIAALDAAYSALEEERRVAGETASRAAMLDAERSRLATELNQAAPRAALVPQLERQLTDLRHADAARQSQMSETERELAQLRADAETSTRTAKYYEDEFARLFADHEQTSKSAKLAADELQSAKAGLEAATQEANAAVSLRTEAGALRTEIANLRSNLEAAQREASEAVRLRSELASAKSGLDAAAADAAELNALRTELAKVKTSAETLGKDAGDVARLRSELAAAHSDLANFRGDIERLTGDNAKSSDLLAKVTADYEAKLKSAIAEIATRTADQRKASEDIAALRQQLANVPKVDHSTDLANLRAELNATNQSLASVRNALEDTTILAASRHDEIERLQSQLSALPAELENYRRFKDALDAANRIAAGLPDKA